MVRFECRMNVGPTWCDKKKRTVGTFVSGLLSVWYLCLLIRGPYATDQQADETDSCRRYGCCRCDGDSDRINCSGEPVLTT